jgi:predicted dehydrogenase
LSKQAGFSEQGQLHVAVVGLGWWGKAIIDSVKDSSNVRVVAGVGHTSASGGDWARERGINFTTDYASVLADPGIRGVLLCTPHSQHAQQIVAAAKAKKHVFCEKPLTLTRKDAVVAVKACEDNGVMLAVGHEHRFKPVVADVLRMVRAGELGTIQTTEAALTHPLRPLPPDNWRLQKSEAPAGTMTALGIHGLDLCVAVNGPAASAYAKVASVGSPTRDTVGALVSFKNGANAEITSLMGPPFSIRFAVFGNKGWIEVRDKAHPQTPQGWILTKSMLGGQPESIEYPPMSIVRACVEAFADAAAGRAHYPITYDEMIDNIAAFEAIAKSSETGRVEAVEN